MNPCILSLANTCLPPLHSAREYSLKVRPCSQNPGWLIYILCVCYRRNWLAVSHHTPIGAMNFSIQILAVGMLLTTTMIHFCHSIPHRTAHNTQSRRLQSGIENKFYCHPAAGSGAPALAVRSTLFPCPPALRPDCPTLWIALSCVGRRLCAIASARAV